jgi:NTP pyrophosphatase (non-canonical NTP hydrolase)
MNFNEYQKLSERTMPKPNKEGNFHKNDFANYAMGLSGEAGEVTDLVKKQLFHGHSIDFRDVEKELGDTLHYLSGLATLYGLSLEAIAIINIEKLKKRYPSGFSEEASVKRVDVKR